MRRESYTFSTMQVGAVGIGNVGTTTVDYLISSNAHDIKFISIDSDYQTLSTSNAHLQIPLGADMGQGSDKWEKTKIASRAAFSARQEIENALTGIQILYIMTGLGGATGSGVVPVVAKIAQDLGIYTIVVVTRPVRSEGIHSARIAIEAINVLEKIVDNLIVLPTNHLKIYPWEQSDSDDAFQTFAHIMFQSIQVVSEFVNHNGLINLDLANLKAVLFNKGGSLTTSGSARGNDRAQRAAQRALYCPEMGLSIHGARGLLISIRASDNLNIWETEIISNIIKNSTYQEAEYDVGVVLDEAMGDEIKVSVLATGFSLENWGEESRVERPVAAARVIDPPKEVPAQFSPATTTMIRPNFTVDSIKKKISDFSITNFPIVAFLRSAFQ